MKNTYWNNNGKHQYSINALISIVPAEGECPKHRPKLERFRRAWNAYYDLYNNGGCNRKYDIRNILKTSSTAFNNRFDEVSEEIEAKMDKIVLDAFSELWTELHPHFEQFRK